MSDSATADAADELTHYKKLFLQHLYFARTHSNGDEGKPLVSSILPPNAFWTAQEKNRFFHGLARYSKLRPDLISAFIGGGKTPTDVMAYIAALEEGSKRDGPAKETEKKRPVARVMSEKWIKLEERLASQLVKQEIRWQTEMQELEREQSKRKKKRKQVAWEEEESQWRREDAMEHLGRYELTHLDSIIRKEVEQIAARPSSMQPESSSTRASSSDPNGRNKSSSPQDSEAGPMTATERRRLQKRLHMRRKRAEAAGVDVNLEEGRLKPGRKSTRPQALSQSVCSSASPSLRQPPTSQDIEMEDDGSSEEGSEEEESDMRRFKTRGLTAIQKTQQTFNELGIDISLIREERMDLFNLARFSDLWSVLTDDQSVGSISHFTIRLLRECLDEFLFELIGKSITLAEAERDMKEGTRVWHEQRGEVKSLHISEALTLMGLSRLQDKSSVLREREAQLEADLTNPQDLAADPEDESATVHNAIYPPLIAHDVLLDEPDLVMEEDVVIDEYEEEDHRAAAIAELTEDLREEEVDQRMDERHERALWKLMGLGDGRTGIPGQEDEDESMAEESQEESTDKDSDYDDDLVDRRQYHNSLRLRPIGRGGVKSQPFIFSEDEEKAEME